MNSRTASTKTSRNATLSIKGFRIDDVLTKIDKVIRRQLVENECSLRQANQKISHLKEQIHDLQRAVNTHIGKNKLKTQALEQERLKLVFQNKNLLSELSILNERVHNLTSEKERLEEQVREKDENEETFKELQLKYKLLENKLELMSSFKEIGEFQGLTGDEEKLKQSEFSNAGRRGTRHFGFNRTIEELDEFEEDSQSKLFRSRQQSLAYSAMALPETQKQIPQKVFSISIVYAQAFNVYQKLHLESTKNVLNINRTLSKESNPNFQIQMPISKNQNILTLNEEAFAEYDVNKSLATPKKKLFDKKEILKSISELPRSTKDSPILCFEKNTLELKSTQDMKKILQFVKFTKSRLIDFSKIRIEKVSSHICEAEKSVKERLNFLNRKLANLGSSHCGLIPTPLCKNGDSFSHLKALYEDAELNQPLRALVFPGPLSTNKEESRLIPFHTKPLTRPISQSFTLTSTYQLLFNKVEKIIERSLSRPSINSRNDSAKSSHQFNGSSNTFPHNDISQTTQIQNDRIKASEFRRFNNFGVFKEGSLQDISQEELSYNRQRVGENSLKGTKAFNLELYKNNRDYLEAFSVELDFEFKTPGQLKNCSSECMLMKTPQRKKSSRNTFYEELPVKDFLDPENHVALNGVSKTSSGNKSYILLKQVDLLKQQVIKLKTEILTLNDLLRLSSENSTALVSLIDSSYKAAWGVISRDSYDPSSYNREELPTIARFLCVDILRLREIFQSQKAEADRLKKELLHITSHSDKVLENQGQSLNASDIFVAKDYSVPMEHRRNLLTNYKLPKQARGDQRKNNIDTLNNSSINPQFVQFHQTANLGSDSQEPFYKFIEIINKNFNPLMKKEITDYFEMQKESFSKIFQELIKILIRLLSKNDYNSQRVEKMHPHGAFDINNCSHNEFWHFLPRMLAEKSHQLMEDDKFIKKIDELISFMLKPVVKEYVKSALSSNIKISAKIPKNMEKAGTDALPKNFNNNNSNLQSSTGYEGVQIKEMASYVNPQFKLSHLRASHQHRAFRSSSIGHNHVQKDDYDEIGINATRMSHTSSQECRDSKIFPSQEISELVLSQRKQQISQLEQSREFFAALLYRFKTIVDDQGSSVKEKLKKLDEISKEIDQQFF